MVKRYDDFTNDLLFQHVQFRRVEKFMRSYLDTGFVISQHRAVTGRLFQELSYFDDTRFSGEVVEDEES